MGIHAENPCVSSPWSPWSSLAEVSTPQLSSSWSRTWILPCPGLCPWMAQELLRVIPVLLPALVLELPELITPSQEPERLGISIQAAPFPDLLTVFAVPSLQQLIKAPSKAIQLRYLSPGSCHNPKGQGSQGKHPQPTPRSRGWERSSWEQPGSSSKQKPCQK